MLYIWVATIGTIATMGSLLVWLGSMCDVAWDLVDDDPIFHPIRYRRARQRRREKQIEADYQEVLRLIDYPTMQPSRDLR